MPIRDEAEALAGALTKSQRRELLTLLPDTPGGSDWEQVRHLCRDGIAKPVKPSESWIPCLLTPFGVKVRAAVIREAQRQAEKKAAAKPQSLGDPEA